MASYALAKPELRVMRQLVPRDLGSIDIGANVGVHTYFLARWSKAVHAFEPNPTLARYLRRAVTDNVTVEPIALSDHQGAATLRIPRLHGLQADPYASIEPAVAALRAEQFADSPDTVKVPMRRLDDLAIAGIGFVKIDVEGHELAVIEGAKNTLREQRPVVLTELDQRYLSRPLDSVLNELMTTLGYAGWYLIEGRLRSVTTFSVERHQTAPLADPDSGPFIENFFFIPPDRIPRSWIG